ncbi:MAG TPA: hypothetical protein VGF06_13015 [Terriglobales bacterium]|jgi:hypothetical protein
MVPGIWLWNALSTISAVVVILACASWTYFFWVKRYQEHRLDRLAQKFRIGGIALGVLLYWIEFKSRNSGPWFPYLVLLTTSLVLIFVFIPDASYLVAQAYMRWRDRNRLP